MDENKEKAEDLALEAAQVAHPNLDFAGFTLQSVEIGVDDLWSVMIYGVSPNTDMTVFLSYAVDLATGEVVNSNR